jgi:hypothetical protein
MGFGHGAWISGETGVFDPGSIRVDLFAFKVCRVPNPRFAIVSSQENRKGSIRGKGGERPMADGFGDDPTFGEFSENDS